MKSISQELYKSSSHLRENETFEEFISHVITPEAIYVQKVSACLFISAEKSYFVLQAAFRNGLKKMTSAMNKYYNTKNKHYVYNPSKGNCLNYFQNDDTSGYTGSRSHLCYFKWNVPI